MVGFLAPFEINTGFHYNTLLFTDLANFPQPISVPVMLIYRAFPYANIPVCVIYITLLKSIRFYIKVTNYSLERFAIERTFILSHNIHFIEHFWMIFSCLIESIISVD